MEVSFLSCLDWGLRSSPARSAASVKESVGGREKAREQGRRRGGGGGEGERQRRVSVQKWQEMRGKGERLAIK